MSNIAARLDRLPICKFHYKFLGIISVGMFFDSLDIYVVSSVMAALVKTNWTTVTGAANFLTASLTGYLLGAAVAGYLGDKFGRRTMFVWSMLIYSIFTILCAFSTNIYMLMLLRFAASFGTGGEIVTGYAVMGEFIPPKQRGKWGNMIMFVVSAGLPIATFMSMFIMPMSSDAWRYMLALPGIPAFLAWFIQRSMPESPRWYESVGRMEEAEKTVAKIESEVERYTGKGLPEIVSAAPTPTMTQEKTNFWSLFSKSLLPRTIVICVIYIVTGLGIYGMTLWIPTHLVKTGLNIAKSLKFTTIMSLGCPLGAVIGYLIVEKISRKWGITFLSILGAILAYFFASSQEENQMILYGFTTITTLYTIMGLTYSVYIPELLPTRLRTTGSGFGMSVARVIAAFSPAGVVLIMNEFGFGGVIFLISALFFLMGLTIAILGIETRGKTLEEIQVQSK